MIYLDLFLIYLDLFLIFDPSTFFLSPSSLVQVAFAVVRGSCKRPRPIDLNEFKCPPALRKAGLTDANVLEHFKQLPVVVERPQRARSLELQRRQLSSGLVGLFHASTAMDLDQTLLAELISSILSGAAASESSSASGSDSESDGSDFVVVKKPVYSRNRFTDGGCLMFEELRAHHIIIYLRSD